MENKADKMMEVKSKILSIMRIHGPSLPVHIAKQVNLSMLFASAFLSELASEKQVRISNMKVGGSPLYYLPGQEEQLEKFSNYLGGKEKEAFTLLKEKALLREDDLDPAIRVAVKSLRDFAFSLTLNLPDKQITFWRFISLNEEEAKKRIEAIFEEVARPDNKKLSEGAKEEIKAKAEEKMEAKPELKIEHKKEEITPETKLETKKTKLEELKEQARKLEEKIEKEKIKEEIKEKPLIEIKEKVKKEKKIEEKPDSEFVVRIRKYLSENDIEILEEIDKRKKDYEAVVRVDSDLGKIELLCIAKDKKGISENDLTLALEKARGKKRPAFFVTNGEINKKAKEYLENWQNMIRFRKI